MLKSMVQSDMLRSCMLYLAKKEKIHYYGYIFIYIICIIIIILLFTSS